MKTRTYASVSVLATLGVLSSLPAYALGLGNIELSSALNEPFKAEISVSSLGEKEAGNLQVQLASNEEFERAGLEKTSALRDLKFEIVERNGATVISISSKKPFREPLVDFLLSATTGTGHMIREYTVLLDPPKSVFKQKTTAPIPAKSPVQTIKQTSPTQYQSTQPSFTPQTATQYGPVRKSDTLWDIALKTRPEKTVTVHQMMMALLKENGSAFIRNNINGLKAGVTLAIPTNAVINELSVKQAQAAVSEQNALWRNRDKTNAKPTTSDPANQLVATPEEQVATAEQVEQQTAEPKSRLKLLSPSEEASSLAEDELAALGNDNITELSEQLTLAQETIEQQAQENIDIKARMAEMEEQIDTLRKLIAIDDPEFAKLQSKLEQEGTVADDDPALEKLSEEIIAALESDQHLAEVTELESEPAAAKLDEQTPAIDEETETASEAKPETEDVVSESVEAKPSQAEPVGFIEQAKAIIAEYKIEAMSAALVLLIAVLLMARRSGGGTGGSKAKTWDEAVKEIEGEDPLPNFTGSQTRETVVSEPVEQDESEAYKSVEELIQDADVFTSYGDLDKAKLTLDEVLKEDPNNNIAIHKLLFVLFRQQNASDFVSLAEKLDIDHESLEWAEIQAWGRELEPEHDLFKQVEEEPEPESVEEVDEQQPIEESTTEEVVAEAPLEFDVRSESTVEETSVDLDLSDNQNDSVDDDLLAFSTDSEVKGDGLSDDSGSNTLETEASELGLSADGISADELTFDIDMDEQVESSDDISLDLSEEPTDLTTSDDLTLDLDESLAEVTDEELESANKALSGETENEEVELDLGDFGQIDEAETKLDLASAYVDMGDPDGARGILEEVLKEGNDEQKARAQAALNELN